MLLVALAGPALGALADVTHWKKLLTGVFTLLGIAASMSLVWVKGSAYWAGSLVFAVGIIGFAGANVFYESLLPHVAREADLDRVSTKGYALGYVGGGILLVLNLLWLSHPTWFFMPNQDFALRACFVSVGVWWALFSWPLFRNVPEPESARGKCRTGNVFKESFGQLGRTLRQLGRYRQLTLFLVAFWIYNDGISTIIKLAVAFGDEIGIGQNDLMLALVITQFVGIPCAFAFGRLGPWLGTKRAIFVGISVYVLICVFGFFMKTATQFYALAIMVGLVQGGTQALSRSMFARMVPKGQSAEFFGFFSTGEKFAGILGPFLFGLIAQLTGSSRWGILSVTLFFFIGAFVLLWVDEAEGQRVAAESESVSV
jgi:UMF1 family MFS transporter